MIEALLLVSGILRIPSLNVPETLAPHSPVLRRFAMKPK